MEIRKNRGQALERLSGIVLKLSQHVIHILRSGRSVGIGFDNSAVNDLFGLLLGKTNDLVRLGLEGIHYTRKGDEITMNEEERAKDAFSPNGWAHALAWGSLYWPLESGYMPATDPSRDRALESIDLATQAQKPNLIKQKQPMEVEYGSALDDIYNQYFIDMLYGNISIEDGTAQLIADWHSQGGDEVLAELNSVYAGK